MKKIITLTALLAILFVIPACHIFLDPDPDLSPRGIFNSLWTSFNELYALFDERLEGKTWEEVREKFYHEIYDGISNYDLFIVCANMLNTLNDPHVSLTSPFSSSVFLTDRFDDFKWFDPETVRDFLVDRGSFAGEGIFLYGVFSEVVQVLMPSVRPRIGYLHISTFLNHTGAGTDLVQNWARDIDGIVRKLQAETDFLILDVRNNDGGIGTNMHYIASRFVSVEKEYLKVSTKNGPGPNDFTTPVSFRVRPAAVRYTRPIVLLTNNWTRSAGEWFVMALLTQNHVTHAGETTNGIFSVSMDRPLINGWVYSISLNRVTGMNGERLEGVGITPKPEHTIENIWIDRDGRPFPYHFYGWDAQLRHALTMF